MFEAIIEDVQRGNFRLQQDAVKGLRQTVANGQTRLALEYTEAVLASVIKCLEELQARVDELEKQLRTKPAPAKPKTASASAAE